MSSNVIIFHPGSRNLYVGRASDSKPQTVPHVIARRNSDVRVRNDTLVPISETRLAENIPHEVESARLQLSLTLQSALNSGVEMNPTASAKISLTDVDALIKSNKSANKAVLGNKQVSCPSVEKLENKAFLIGQDALDVSANESFSVYCPWRRGQLNLNRNVGGSITSVIADLEDIWGSCLTDKLGIPRNDIQNFQAVVVVPVMLDRVHAREIMNLLINRLGFKKAYLVQDHVCATFGCGIACATVVDVGDQKISVSCVEDGVSYPQSRLELKYGGGDLTVALWNQLLKASFPLSIEITQQWDLERLNDLKEKFCNVDLKSYKSSPRAEKIVWEKPGNLPIEYNVYFGDELLIVPLSYFNPDLLRGSVGTKAVISYIPQPSVKDDPFDKIYLAEAPSSKQFGQKDNDDKEKGSNEADSIEKSDNSEMPFETLLGMDQAILQSIDSSNVSDDDLKRRWYSCIVVVGGGAKFKGFADFMKERMRTVIPSKWLTSDNDTPDQSNELPKIISSVKNNGDPATTPWKGAAVLSSLESAKDLWISEKEWNKYGSKILREKSLFHY